jgi:aerobic carbon-monoxide dehydrogenase medium subunit
VKPAPFEYFRPRSVEEALDLLAEHGPDAKPLAGGQSLIPAMNFRLAAPAVLVDLNEAAGLSNVTAQADGLHIGGMTRHRTLERSATVARDAPLVTAAMPFVAHAAIRTRGTVGGSLAHADPAAELPAVMLALDAVFTVRSREGSRTVRAADFFTGLFTTTLAAGELLTEVAIPPRAPRSAYAFQEIARRHGDYALAGVAAAVAVDEHGRCTSAKVALLSVSDRPVLAEHASRGLEGEQPTADAIGAAAAAAAAHDIDPPGDIHASSDYRRHLAAVLMRRVLERAFFDAGRLVQGRPILET